MKIKVTQEHINRGQRDHAQMCPVALALSDAFPKAWGILVASPTFATACISNIEWKYTPDVARFVDHFDKGKEVEPFEFEIPDEVLKLKSADLL